MVVLLKVEEMDFVIEVELEWTHVFIYIVYIVHVIDVIDRVHIDAHIDVVHIHLL